jgi:hypothetical protein
VLSFTGTKLEEMGTQLELSYCFLKALHEIQEYQRDHEIATVSLKLHAYNRTGVHLLQSYDL